MRITRVYVAADLWHFSGSLAQSAGAPAPIVPRQFDQERTACSRSVLRALRTPFLLHHDQIRGFVYDVDTHRLHEIVVE